MNIAADTVPAVSLDWAKDAVTQVPYQVYTDQAIFDLEQQRIFRGPTWSFVALEAEIPKPGDYKSTYIGDTPVVVTRDQGGGLHCWVNRCAHRGARVCRDNWGNAERHTCVYHNWVFEASGDLASAAFRHGIKGKGGYPETFRLEDHGLQKLRVEAYKGIVFATFDPTLEPLAEYFGPKMTHWIDRVMTGPVEFLGTTCQHIQSNWKLYVENVKDPYHASLLHLFHATFGVYRSSMGGGCQTDDARGLHSMIRAFLIEDEDKSQYASDLIRSYAEDVKLNDPTFLDVRRELDPVFTNHIQFLFPGMVLQQIHNTLACRQILPKGPDSFELIFHFFGYADDDDELREMRVRQANFVGPAGYISMEDGEATELVQRAIHRDQDKFSYVGLNGDSRGDDENLLSEALIRSYWTGYREIMGL